MPAAPGHHPKSLANLKRSGHSQNFVTKVAAQLNWEKRRLLAAKAIGHITYEAMRDPEWQTLTLERRTAILTINQQLVVFKNELNKLIELYEAVKHTPLRTPEAHLLALRERRMARARRSAQKQVP